MKDKLVLHRCCVVCFVFVGLTLAHAPLARAQSEGNNDRLVAEGVVAPGIAADAQPQHAGPVSANVSFSQAFGSIGGDLRNMFTLQNGTVMALFGSAALVAHQWDRPAATTAQTMSMDVAQPGNVIGGMMTQMAAGVATFAAGRISGSPRITSLGSDLVRAQILSQAVVQGLKFSAARTRPDGSNSLSFPSGHTATAFATATVLQQNFGWKAGVPAYALGTYVAASRMGSNKHFLSDVLFGAGLGIVAGRSVTIGSGDAKFALGVAPAPGGGAAVIFTKK